MAVANPCLQNDWDEWKRKMRGNRRIPWRERMMRWIKLEVRVEEDGEDVDGKEENVSEEEEGNEAGEKVKEEEEEEGGGDPEKGKDNKKGDEEGEWDSTEENERKHVEEEEVNKAEIKNGEEEEKDEVAREIKEMEEEDEEEEKELTKEDERVDVEESDVEAEVQEEDEVDEGEETKEKEEEVTVEVMREAEGREEEGENDIRQVEEEKMVKDEDDEGEEHQEEEHNGQYDPEDQFSDEMGRIQAENQENRAEEDENRMEKDDDSDSVETMNIKESDVTGSENEFHNLERLTVGNWCDEDSEELEEPDGNGMFEARTAQETNEESGEGQKLTDEESWTTQEELQDDYEDLQGEECTDDEEAEQFIDEDGGDSDEDEVKIYCKDDYPTDIFLIFNEFQESSILTDLTLSAEDGRSFSVHSLVLAAVSSLIWRNLSRRRAERKVEDTGAQRWSLLLGPEVDHVGLEAVVEFAYTGLISCLNKDNVDQIKAAAQSLGAPRVLDLCAEEEEEAANTEGQRKKERMSAAQQMRINLQFIKQLWTDRVGCDVVLEALGASLHVHRVILAVSSDYFRGMFTLGMKESHQHCVTLPFLLASELEVLIGCSYSGALPLSWSCVFEITSTALQLQYQPTLSLCLNFLHQEMNPDSCLDVVSFAEAYEMPQLLEVADDFVLRQFQKVASTSKFKDLPARQLLKYLSSCSLCVPSELVVFKAVVTWIQAKPKTRLRLSRVLMKSVHFPLMTFREFREVQSQTFWSDHSLGALYEAVFEDFCSNETTLQNRCRIYLPKESLVLIGGDQISDDLGRRSISRELWFGNSLRNHTGFKKAMEWRRLGEMPEPARFSHEVAVLNGHLYLFGGKKYYGNGDILSSVYRFDPLQNSWEGLAEMQENRSNFSVVILDGKIYAIGGYCGPDFRDSVERYCPTTNTWSFTWPLDLPLNGHVAKVLQGRIFISGGQNSDYVCLASMFLYHPEMGSTYLANMAEPRAHHCMEILGECLYVAGGITTDDDVTVVDQLACEVYSPVADSWTAFAPLPVPHVGAGSALLEGKFYVLGGYSQEDYSDTKMVHRYDATLQRWENMGRMPGPNNDIRACLLCLPQHLRL